MASETLEGPSYGGYVCFAGERMAVQAGEYARLASGHRSRDGAHRSCGQRDDIRPLHRDERAGRPMDRQGGLGL